MIVKIIKEKKDNKIAILNYTTKIPVETTIAEIEKMLAESSAQKILKEYDNDSNIQSITFVIGTSKGNLSFKLPMNVDAVMQTLENQSGEYRRQTPREGGYGKKVRVISRNMINIDQARRVGWRIIKDWLEAQLALYFLQMVKIEEIFLPYMYNEKTGQTMFQLLENRGFNFQLEDKSKPVS